MANKSPRAVFPAITTVLTLIAAVASIIMVIRAGRHNSSVVLPILFICWVGSPFIAVFLVNRISTPWSALTRKTLHWVMLIISTGCLISYSGLLSPPGTKPAFVFLITPLLAWLLIVTAIPLSASISRSKQRSQK